jgi:hypothetical protein
MKTQIIIHREDHPNELHDEASRPSILALSSSCTTSDASTSEAMLPNYIPLSMNRIVACVSAFPPKSTLFDTNSVRAVAYATNNHGGCIAYIICAVIFVFVFSNNQS